MIQQLSIGEFEQEQKERINNLSEVKEEESFFIVEEEKTKIKEIKEVKKPKLTQEERLKQQLEILQQEQKERLEELNQKLSKELIEEVEQLLGCDQEIGNLIATLNEIQR